jgi:hypothetical protein
VLRRIFRPKRERNFWMNNNLYFSPNITILIKSWRVMLTGHVVCMGDMRSAFRRSQPEGKGPYSNVVLGWMLTTKWILKTGLIWLRIDPVAAACEHRNGPLLGSMEGRDFLY